ncbi:WAT1-related protein At1g68170-like isoform X2 [Nymphaea colorata]|uniref:WAT1-related protein At1g68170-like isoform X2 n=1 Tax=Nymphaea colorata TaxID=210225 RepID=UPI00214EDCEE|nr:WAT1-related protein At1g68170-like isoform X2 [Nymphaea colorata]
MKAVLYMVVVHVIVAGMNILYKLSADGGRMSLRVLVAYRYMFGAAFLCPLAFFLERASLNQNLYIAALKMTSATLAVAMTNLLPAFTFILAIMFRLERLEIRSSRSQSKVLGTAVGVCGAMLLTFYHGAKLQLWSFHTHLPHHHPNQHQSGNQVLGSMLAMANTLSYATWLIIQAKMSKRYPHPYSSSALLNLFAAIQSTCVAAITDWDPSAWELRWDVNLLTIIYTGILVSGLVVALMSWAIQMRGPLFVSAFNPLSLVIVAFFGSIFLDEALHLGSVVGAGLIILGLYTVLWGKGKEVKELVQLQAHRSAGEATKLDSDGLHSNPAGAGIGANQVPEHSIKEDQIDSVQL